MTRVQEKFCVNPAQSRHRQ